MSDVHNEWNSPPSRPAATPPAPAAPRPAPPAAPVTTATRPPAAAAVRRDDGGGRDTRLLVGIGAVVALLVLFALVVAGRDSSTTDCTIPWTNWIARSEGGDITILNADAIDRPPVCATEFGAGDGLMAHGPAV